MKRQYEAPALEIIEFYGESIITMSGVTGDETSSQNDNMLDVGGTGWGE